MNNLRRISLLVVMLLALVTINTYAGNYKTENDVINPELKAKLESKLLEAQLGTEYFVVIPPIFNESGNYATEIYVGSREPCTVYIEQPNNLGLINVLYITKPYTIVKQKASQDWTVGGYDEEPEDFALKIWSDKPIMVYLGAHTAYVADGYMVLPVNALGTRYVQCSWKTRESTIVWY